MLVCVPQVKAKGVEGLIPVENPNRVAAKTIKAKDVDVNAAVNLSRKERLVWHCRYSCQEGVLWWLLCYHMITTRATAL